MEELKPCPFCGGEPRIDSVSVSADLGSAELLRTFTIRCSECSVPKINYTLKVRITERSVHEIDVSKQLDAIKAWNTRAYEKENDNG